MNGSTAMRPTLVLAKGSESVKGVGPTPVLQIQRPKGMTVLSVRVSWPSSTFLTTPCKQTVPHRGVKTDEQADCILVTEAEGNDCVTYEGELASFYLLNHALQES